MKPVYQGTYWVVTLFEYKYDNGDVYIIRASNITDQEPFIARGICIPHDPDLDTYWKSKYADTHSVMYLLPLEYQGMSSSKNRFIFPNSLIFDREKEARECAIELLDEYVVKTFDERLQEAKEIWKTLKLGWNIYKTIHGIPSYIETLDRWLN
ncbi:MAG: hypothetical protein U7127_20795 [Phormidium sp.]